VGGSETLQGGSEKENNISSVFEGSQTLPVCPSERQVNNKYTMAKKYENCAY
jgi:hypothetical protein